MALIHPKPTLVQRMREQLEDDIVEGRLRPGEQLDIDEIAQRFSVSRTPVREALQQLEASGMVEVMPKKGTYVASISAARLIQMFEVMAELEAMCARLAARRADAELLVDLAAAVNACEAEGRTGDPNAYYHANEGFHQLIYRASGNDFLVQQTIQLKNRLKPYRRMQLQVRNRISQSLSEHAELVSAIQLADEERAAKAARQHVLVQGERFTDLISMVNQRVLQPSDN